MVINIAEIELNQTERENIIDAIEYLNACNNSIDGCLSFNILIFSRYEDKIMIYEEWESVEKFKSYLKTEYFKKFLAVLELSLAEPVFKIIECKKVHDFQWIENVILNDQTFKTINHDIK